MATTFVNTIKLPVSTSAVVEAETWPAGSIYYDTTSSSIRWYNGSAWADLNAGSGTAYMPTGSIQPWTGSSTPSGWLVCNGSAVSRTTYASLFTVISTSFGVGDGSTTFNLPDLQGYQLVGATLATGPIDNTSTYRVGSNDANTITTHSSEAHSHTITYASYSEIAHTQSHSHSAAPALASSGAHTHTGTSVTSNPGQSHTHTSSVGAPNTQTVGTGSTQRTSSTHTHTGPSVSTNTHTHTVTIGSQASTGGHTHTVTISLTAPSDGLTAASANPTSHTHTTTVANSAGHTHTDHSYKTIFMHYIVKT
jgi:microcystin-dependent protein